MIELALNELKNVELNILKQFAKVCDRLSLRYSLAGGTLLGAIRHKGFIPWDDDIDVFMPRPDYDKFIKYCSKNKLPFGLFCHETNTKCKILWAKLYDPNTLLIETYMENIDLSGVYIDVFPIDGLGNTKSEATAKFRKTWLLRELLVASKWQHFFRSNTHAWYIEPVRYVLYLLSRFISQSWLISVIEKDCRSIDFDKSKYACCIFGVYRQKEIMEQKIYTNYIDMIFEGEKFKGVADYDVYLTHFYGDYMTLPPVEKRKTHHTFKAYWRDKV